MRIVDRLVLDTDVTSFLFNQDPIRGPRYRAQTDGRTLYLPFIVVAEMLFGADVRGWGSDRRAELQEFLGRYAIVESDPDICGVWATIRADAQRRGRPIERQDAWIAAVALSMNLPLVTHNARHFAGVPLLRIVSEPDR